MTTIGASRRFPMLKSPIPIGIADVTTVEADLEDIFLRLTNGQPKG